jgi:hypothetical protein
MAYGQYKLVCCRGTLKAVAIAFEGVEAYLHSMQQQQQ